MAASVSASYKLPTERFFDPMCLTAQNPLIRLLLSRFLRSVGKVDPATQEEDDQRHRHAEPEPLKKS